MPVPQDYEALFTRWCAQRVPQSARARLQVSYRIHGDEVTIVRRRPPAYPELDSAWTSTRVAQLRHNDPDKGSWRLYRPDDTSDDGWAGYDHPPATTPEALLAEIEVDPALVFWP